MGDYTTAGLVAGMSERVSQKIAGLSKAGVLDGLWAELLASEGVCWGRAVSLSMSPTIKDGDRILVETVTPDRVRFGDVIVFRRGKTMVIHRMLGRRVIAGRRYFIEKGDGNLHGGLVAEVDLVGRVQAIDGASGVMEVLRGRRRLLQYAIGRYSQAIMWLWLAIEAVSRGGRRSGATDPWAIRFHRGTRLPFRVLRRATRML